MRNFKLLIVWVLFGGIIVNCDLPSTPKDPNFTTSHKVEAPILINKTIQFLGGGDDTDVLIDTTGSEFDSLFVIADGGPDEGLISIAVEEEFELGDLNDAIPTIGIDPASFSSEVGEIEIGSFSSGGDNLGTVDIQTVTGNDPNLIPAGLPIPAGNNAVNPVELSVGSNTDFFVSAEIKRGSIDIEITNNLGFDFRVTEIQLYDTVSSATIGSPAEFSAANGNQLLSDGSPRVASVSFAGGATLANIGIKLIIFWDGFNFPANPGLLSVNSLEGNGLVASSVEAAVTAIDFSSKSTTTFDAAEFQYTSPDHYVELASGEIAISPIENGLDLTIEELVISFPGIRTAPYTEADSLVISYLGAEKILRNSSSVAKSIDLSEYRIYANNNTVEYTISALTENTQAAAAGDQTREINESQSISSSVSINNSSIATAFGEIASQTVILGDDDASNGLDIIDLYNDIETSLTEIDGLDELSSEIDGIEFADASLSINYTSNIGVPTTIYMAMLGIDGEDQELYLNGISGTELEVEEGAPINGIVANGVQLSRDQMIKFTIQPSSNGEAITSSVEFNSRNTNVNDFLNALPKEIRFVGRAVVNESGEEATISTPLEFDPGIIVDLPLYFSADGASIELVEDGSDLSDLPDEDEDVQITDGQLIVSYENGLPLGFDINIEFLDDLGGVITSIPLAGDTPIELSAATVDQITRFVTTDAVDNLIISLTEDQLQSIANTDSVAINAALNTFASEEVKIRNTDSITLSVSASVTIQNEVNN